MTDEIARRPAPVVYVTDFGFEDFDPADLFDLAYLLGSHDHDLRGVCLTRPDAGGERVLDNLSQYNATPPAYYTGPDGLRAFLAAQAEAVNLVVVGGYGGVAALLADDRAFFRERVARLFLVGGHINEYAPGIAPRLPFDPRLRDLNPERFKPSGDGRVGSNTDAWAALLTSGEGVIWLPRDICLWRYAAPGVLADGGPLTEFLRRELFWSNWQTRRFSDHYAAADAPVLLSALPALLLCVEPDPFAWMRLFRVIPARAEASEGRLTAFTTTTDAPNLYTVVAIDGQALGKLLTARLRTRPLATI